MVKVIGCIRCPRSCRLTVANEGGKIKVEGNLCPRGREYGEQEINRPMRMVTSLVKVEGGDKPVLPVKTTGPVPKADIKLVLDKIMAITVKAPVKAGEVVCFGVDGKVDVVATSDVMKI